MSDDRPGWLLATGKPQAMSGYRTSNAMAAAMQLRAELGAIDDAQLVLDTLDGETDVFDVLDALVEAVSKDSLLIDAARERVKRLEARKDRMRATVQQMLEALELKKVERPLYTASLTYNSKALVTDDTLLPPQYIRHSPDMIGINKALRAGEQIPGATLSNPQPTLRVTTK